MFRRGARWGWLTIFALCNLTFWVAVAVAVGLTVSDEVDLGVEAFIREWQATAVAAWEQASVRVLDTKPQPTSGTLQAVQEKPTASVVWPNTPTPSPGSHTEPTPIPQVEATSISQSTDANPQSTEPSSNNSSGQTQEPTPQSSLISPLLIADPGLEGLIQLDAEMGRSAVGRAVQIRYQEDALNRELAALLNDYPNLPYRNVQADLQRDQVTVTGNVTLLGLDVDTEVQGKVVAQECLPQVEIQSISIAGVVAPGFFKDQIKEIVQESLSWYPVDYPLCLQQIVLEDGYVTIYGTRR